LSKPHSRFVHIHFCQSHTLVSCIFASVKATLSFRAYSLLPKPHSRFVHIHFCQSHTLVSCMFTSIKATLSFSAYSLTDAISEMSEVSKEYHCCVKTLIFVNPFRSLDHKLLYSILTPPPVHRLPRILVSCRNILSVRD
jgi:hypothetical protein